MEFLKNICPKNKVFGLVLDLEYMFMQIAKCNMFFHTGNFENKLVSFWINFLIRCQEQWMGGGNLAGLMN
jgi:hypothetical protein